MSPLHSDLAAAAFHVGDPALFTYIKGERRVIVPVVISEVWSLLEMDTETTAVMKSTVIGYAVSSGRGGELCVATGSLRPNTALDHIVATLDGMDDAPHSTAAGPAELRSPPENKCGPHPNSGGTKSTDDESVFISH